ncbi:MAG: hypothetical protein WCF98_02150 [Synechococcus sp. ELA057]
MPRLVIVDPAHRSAVGHHDGVNRALLDQLGARGWLAELWADVALEAEADAPHPLRGVFSGCGYEDPRLWRDLHSQQLLAQRMAQQLQLAAGESDGEPVAAWMGHSLLPFQLLGLARHLADAPAARVLISPMFAPGETLTGDAGDSQAVSNCRVALAALARAVRQRGHRLTLGFPSVQQQRRYAPLLSATGLESAGVHPAVVGAGQAAAAPASAPPQVLLHWGDLKAGKGRGEALAVLEALLAEGVPPALQGWRWLFHHHSRERLEVEERDLLEQTAAADLNLHRLEGAVPALQMQRELAACPVALLAYDPERYAERSSGMLWHWAASRRAVGQGGRAVGYGRGWLAEEAMALDLPWQAPTGHSGSAWLAALAVAAAAPIPPVGAGAYAHAVFDQSFATWCDAQLGEP